MKYKPNREAAQTNKVSWSHNTENEMKNNPNQHAANKVSWSLSTDNEMKNKPT